MNRNDGGDDSDREEHHEEPGGEWSMSDADSEFTSLQAETAELDYEGLLDDPEYMDFLEAFGELEMPSDSGVDFAELVEEEGTAADDPEAESTDGTDRHVSPALPPGGATDAPAADGGEAIEEPASKADTSDAEPSAAMDELIALVSEESVTDEQRAELREALGVGPPKRVEVQLNHLKSRFLDLEAYIQAMEDIIDAEADPLNDIESLQEDVESIRREIDGVPVRLDALEASVESLATERTEDVEELEASIEALRSSVRHDVSTLTRNLRSVLEWRKRLEEAVRYEESREATDATAIGPRGTDEEKDGATDRSFEFPQQ